MWASGQAKQQPPAGSMRHAVQNATLVRTPPTAGEGEAGTQHTSDHPWRGCDVCAAARVTLLLVLLVLALAIRCTRGNELAAQRGAQTLVLPPLLCWRVLVRAPPVAAARCPSPGRQ